MAGSKENKDIPKATGIEAAATSMEAKQEDKATETKERLREKTPTQKIEDSIREKFVGLIKVMSPDNKNMAQLQKSNPEAYISALEIRKNQIDALLSEYSKKIQGDVEKMGVLSNLKFEYSKLENSYRKKIILTQLQVIENKTQELNRLMVDPAATLEKIETCKNTLVASADNYMHNYLETIDSLPLADRTFVTERANDLMQKQGKALDQFNAFTKRKNMAETSDLEKQITNMNAPRAQEKLQAAVANRALLKNDTAEYIRQIKLARKSATWDEKLEKAYSDNITAEVTSPLLDRITRLGRFNDLEEVTTPRAHVCQQELEKLKASLELLVTTLPTKDQVSARDMLGQAKGVLDHYSENVQEKAEASTQQKAAISTTPVSPIAAEKKVIVNSSSSPTLISVRQEIALFNGQIRGTQVSQLNLGELNKYEDKLEQEFKANETKVKDIVNKTTQEVTGPLAKRFPEIIPEKAESMQQLQVIFNIGTRKQYESKLHEIHRTQAIIVLVSDSHLAKSNPSEYIAYVQALASSASLSGYAKEIYEKNLNDAVVAPLARMMNTDSGTNISRLLDRKEVLLGHIPQSQRDKQELKEIEQKIDTQVAILLQLKEKVSAISPNLPPEVKKIAEREVKNVDDILARRNDNSKDYNAGWDGPPETPKATYPKATTVKTASTKTEPQETKQHTSKPAVTAKPGWVARIFAKKEQKVAAAPKVEKNQSGPTLTH